MMLIVKEKCLYLFIVKYWFFFCFFGLNLKKILFKFRKKDYRNIGFWYLKLGIDISLIIFYREIDKMRNYFRWNIVFKIFEEFFGF